MDLDQRVCKFLGIMNFYLMNKCFELTTVYLSKSAGRYGQEPGGGGVGVGVGTRI